MVCQRRVEPRRRQAEQYVTVGPSQHVRGGQSGDVAGEAADASAGIEDVGGCNAGQRNAGGQRRIAQQRSHLGHVEHGGTSGGTKGCRAVASVECVARPNACFDAGRRREDCAGRIFRERIYIDREGAPATLALSLQRSVLRASW